MWKESLSPILLLYFLSISCICNDLWTVSNMAGNYTEMSISPMWEENLCKVGRRWSEMPLHTHSKRKCCGHLGYSVSYPPVLFCKHTNSDTGTHSCKHKHATKPCSNSNILSFTSCINTHTHTHWEALPNARLDVQPRCYTELMKSGCHASAWQVSLTKQIPIYMQHGRQGPCLMLMPGTL